MLVKASDKFRFLYENKQSRINIFYGGRGGGKTTEIKNFLMLKILKEKNLRIFALREHKTQLKQSVYFEFLSFIKEHDLHGDFEKGKETFTSSHNNKIFEITASVITCNLTNSQIIFSGVNDNTVMALKSASQIDICWVEEANFLTKYTFDILEPTLRNENSFFIFTFNPQLESDFVYQLAINPISGYVKSVFINLFDNPFLPQVMRKSYELSLKMVSQGISTLAKHRHIWEGLPMPLDEECIFNDNVFTDCIINTYDKSLKSYVKVVLGIDPATTNKDYSNETGIILAGKTKDEVAHIIADYSGKHTPRDLSVIVSNLYKTLRIDSIIVETNNGGDFIKAALLSDMPYLPIKEVRAVSDKKSRAYPVAVLMSMSKILIYDEIKENIFLQMKKLTNKGYNGLKGESPDRFEALEWACYDLFNINEKDTQNTIFNTALFKCDVNSYVADTMRYGVISGDIYVVIEFDIILFDKEKRLNFKSCILDKSNNLNALPKHYQDTAFKFNSLSQELGLNTYNDSGLDLIQKAHNATARINNNINVYNVLAYEFGGYYGNQLIKSLDNFNLDTKNDIVTECFCDVINDFL